MKHSWLPSYSRNSLIAFAILFSTSSARGVHTTNSYVNAAGMPWDTGIVGTWSVGAPAIGNAACIISNTGIKTVFIIDSTALSSLTISNLLISAPVGPNSNALTLFTTNTLTVLQNIIVGASGAINMSNSTIDVRGLSAGFVIDNGNITISNRASFIATNALSGLDIGHNGTGSFNVKGGRLLIIDEEVGTFAGDKGTLTIAGGTNVVTSDGMFIGDSSHATGVVWITSGALVETNTSIYVGNLGSGLITLSNGNLTAEQLIIGNTAGGTGTLTVNGGTVETPDFGLLFPLILGQSAVGTGTVFVSGGTFINTNGTPRIGDSGAGSFLITNGTVLLRRAVLGYSGGGNGTLSVSGGSLKLTGTGNDFSMGDVAGSRGTFLLSGGSLAMTNDPGNTVFVGNGGTGAWTQSGGTASVVKVFLANGVGGKGTLTLSGGLLTGDGTLSVGEGSGGTGTVWVTGGTLSITNADSFISSPSDAAGSMTVSNGLVALRSLTVGVFGNGSLTIAGGTLNASIGLTLAGNSTSSVNLTQSGGWLIASNGVSTCLGTVNIQSTGGTWLGGGLTFAFGNPGTFTVSGGTNIFNSSLNVGSSSGSGSVWVTSGQLTATNATTTLGSSAFGQLTVTGGVVQLRDVSVGSGSPDGRFIVAGGSTTLAGPLTVGTGFSATGLVTVTGGTLTTTNITLAFLFSTGTMTVSGGNVQAFDLNLGPPPGGSGRLIMSGGTLGISKLNVFSASDFVTFNAGTINNGGAAVTNGLQFVVGNGSSNATYHLLGGLHAFATGLRVRNSATLSGCGTVSATVVVDAGGTVVADCGGTLTFAGSVTNNGTMIATGGTTLEANGVVVNNGLINAIHGVTNFTGGIVNNGVILDANGDYDGDGQSNLAEDLAGTDPTNSASVFRITATTQEGNDIRVTWMTAPGKTNALERTAGDVNGSYSNSFAAVFTVTNTVGTTTNYLDVGAATNAPALYYRVRLVP